MVVDDDDLDYLAEITNGFTGAELENIILKVVSIYFKINWTLNN